MKPNFVQPLCHFRPLIFVAVVLAVAILVGGQKPVRSQDSKPDLLTPESGAAVPQDFEPGQAQWPNLKLGQPVQRELAPRERHGYLVNLEAGQFVKFELWQRDTIIEVTIYSPTGERLYLRRRTGVPTPQGRLHETKLVADNAGVYRVELTPIPEQKTAGQYQFTWLEQRPANEDDRALQGAQRAWEVVGELQNRYTFGMPDERRSIRERREFDRMIGIGEESLAVLQRLLPQSLDVGNLGVVLANMYSYRGYYGDAERIEQLWEVVTKNREQVLGPYDPEVAELYQMLGKVANPAHAEKWYRKAVSAAEGKTRAENTFVAVMLSDLANNLRELGETARADETLRRAAAIVEKALADPKCLADPVCQQEVIVPLISLGAAKLEQGDLSGAEWRLQQAWPLWANRKESDIYARGPELLLQLGRLSQLKGDYAQAESFFRQLIERDEMNGTHPLYSGNYQRQLGSLLLAKGDYAQAAESFREAQRALEKTGKSPALAGLMRDWRRLHLATGQFEAAMAAQQQAVEITESNLSGLLVSGSEWEKLKLLDLAQRETFETLMLHAKYAPHSDSALRLAFTTWLQRKGRLLDEMSQTASLLRGRLSPELMPLFNDLLNRQSQLARLATGLRDEKDVDSQVAQLTQEIAQLQRGISTRSKTFRVQTQPVTLDAVQSALPEQAALLDFARIEPVDEQTKEPQSAKYFVYILLPKSQPRWIDLGEAKEIERLVAAWRKMLDPIAPSSQSLLGQRKLARQLDALIMQPIRTELGNVRQVFVAPDGALNLIPFAALIDERGRELVRDYLFIHLTSGRDLLRLQVKHQSNDDVLVVAAPNYDDGGGAAPAPLTAVPDERAGLVSRGASVFGPFKPLPQALAEAEAVKRQFPQARLLLGAEATESAVKQVQHPAIFHLITHGLFLKDQDMGKAAGQLENPLLRSWLVLAGANQRKSGKDDGILTAYEAAALDLWGTKLVVLSACETGNGEVKNGEGVMGLRRALVLAGAETQVSSLWRADDEATQKLMLSFYSNLKAKMGRAEALRQAQLKMLRGGVFPNPYYWANFICIGEWKSLDQ
ncbi:MAG: CHAT domain-containing protein [Acidobacteriota bacterium]